MTRRKCMRGHECVLGLFFVLGVVTGITQAPSSATSVSSYNALVAAIASAGSTDDIVISLSDVTGTGPQSVRQIVLPNEIKIPGTYSLTIYADGVQLDGRSSNRIFTIAAGASLTLYDAKLSSGNASNTDSSDDKYGGGIYDLGSGSSVYLVDTDGRSCYAAFGGFGALTDDGGSTGSDWTIEGGTFSSNYAAQRGGGFYMTGGSTLTATDITLSSNEADRTGGGFFIGGSSTLYTLCYDFRNNDPESVITAPVGTNTWNNFGTTCSPVFQPSPGPTPEPTVSPTHIPTPEPSAAPTPNPTPVPTPYPTPAPTPEPTPAPTSAPTITPTAAPTISPTSASTPAPTTSPTVSPTALPTPDPTAAPTTVPSPAPTSAPTQSPSPAPTSAPTPEPTSDPTASPTAAPTATPTPAPTAAPTSAPTAAPTSAPTPAPTANPTSAPTAVPTADPTPAPTATPTSTPTAVPTADPTPAPTVTPTAAPSSTPTTSPTSAPTPAPTAAPTSVPTAAPTSAPTLTPTPEPSGAPTAAPNPVPTTTPSSTPTVPPTSIPSPLPSLYPTEEPSLVPTLDPSECPSLVPSQLPTTSPTLAPSPLPQMIPTALPSAVPSQRPSEQPSGSPTLIPSSLPSEKPTVTPTSLPTLVPITAPTETPTLTPSSVPSTIPSLFPTQQPTVIPTALPTLVPITAPTETPSVTPTSLPTLVPITAPTDTPTATPTSNPTEYPTLEPSQLPTTSPTLIPSPLPQMSPTATPSAIPSQLPTQQPSVGPTLIPSPLPSEQPTITPTSLPTLVPITAPTEVPTLTPTSIPSNTPSLLPTEQPSAIPTSVPTLVPITAPTEVPTLTPTSVPSNIPSLLPTEQPSATPTFLPTLLPVDAPTAAPTVTPTAAPSEIPSLLPTALPSIIPTPGPTESPTLEPSQQPSETPTPAPSPVPQMAPTAMPSAVPSLVPSVLPSEIPTSRPSSCPSGKPTTVPTSFPTQVPLTAPTETPTGIPTSVPSSIPTSEPTETPSLLPSSLPTLAPLSAPTNAPTAMPTPSPSMLPSSVPSEIPAPLPTAVPTVVPAPEPSASPSQIPTELPTLEPTTSQPSILPSPSPTLEPTTHKPSLWPTKIPTSEPTSLPTMHPTTLPTKVPTMCPTPLPSLTPSSCPSTVPTSRPTASPTIVPTSTPSQSPSNQPTSVPTASPTSCPSSDPTVVPTSVPTAAPSINPTPQPSFAPTETPTSRPSSMPSSRPSIAPSSIPTAGPTTPAPSDTPSLAPSISVESGRAIIDLEPTSLVPTTAAPTTSDVWDLTSGAVFSGMDSDQAEGNSNVFDSAIAFLGQVRTSQVSTEYATASFRRRQRRTLLDDSDAIKEFHLLYTVTGRGDSSKIQGNIEDITTEDMSVAIEIAALELGVESAFGGLQTLGVDEVSVQFRPTAMPTEMPITSVPTTDIPTTNIPTTDIPITATPATVAPTTLTPTTLTPTMELSPLPTTPSPSTDVPYPEPSAKPTLVPTLSLEPTMLLEPSPRPTTARPSPVPTSQPSLNPSTAVPTLNPSSSLPSSEPTSVPTASPSLLPCTDIDDNELPDPPVLESAQFSTSGGSITFTFDSGTDQANINTGESFHCNQIFDFPDVNLTTCSWSTSTECVANVHDALNLIPGTNASVLSGVLSPECDNSALNTRCECYKKANSSSVFVTHSDTALVPGVILSGATTLAACENEAHISAHHSTGSGGRAFTYVWSIEIIGNVTGTDEEIDAAYAAVNSIVSRANAGTGYSILNLTSDEMIDLAVADATDIDISLTLENFLQFQGSGDLSVFVSDDDVPTVEIIGGNSQTMNRADELAVHAEGIATSCDGRSLVERTVDYEWTLYQDRRPNFGLENTGLSSTSSDARFFKLSSYALEANSSYLLKTLVIDEYNGLNASAWTQIQVGISDISAIIKGGNRQQYLNKTVVLSAADSIDGDIEDLSGAAAGLLFSWSCEVANNDTLATACASIEPIPGNETLSFDGNHLGAGDFIFTLTAYTTDGRSSTAESTLSLMTTSNPTVTIDAASTSGTVANVARVVMYGNVDINTDEYASWTMLTQWTLTKGDLADGLSLSDWATTETSISGSAATGRGHNLVLSSGALVSGAKYTFRLEAILEESGAVLGYAENSIYVSSPPSGGTISISPALGGLALQTLYQISTSGWVSDLEPLTYAYYATYDSDGRSIQTTLRESTRSTVLDRVYLPDGDILLQIVAQDTLGSEAEITTSLTVAQSDLEDEELTNYTLTSLEIAFAHNSDEEVCQIVTSAASAAENNTDTLDVLINAMYMVVDDLDGEEDLIAMAVTALEAPCSYASSLSTTTAATALDTAEQLAELSTQVGMSTDTATALATTLSYLLTTDLFVSTTTPNSTIVYEDDSAETETDELSEEESDDDSLIVSLQSTNIGVLVNDTASNLMTSAVDSMCASTIWDAVPGERSSDIVSEHVNTAAQRLSANGTSRSLRPVGSSSLIELPDSLDDDGNNYDVWIGEIAINPYGADSNGTDIDSHVLRVGYTAATDDRRRRGRRQLRLQNESTSSTEIGVEIATERDVSTFYDSSGNLTVSLTCECGYEGNVSYTCPDGTLISKLCDGVPGTFNISCPSSSSDCQTWSGSLWSDQECRTVTTSSNTTRCVCKINAVEAESFSTKTSILATLEAYEAGLTAKPNLSRALYMLITLGALIIFCIVFHVWGRYLDRRDRRILDGRSTELRYVSKKKLDQKRIQRMYSADEVAFALSDVKTRHDIWTFAPRLSRFLKAVKYKHPFTNWYYYYSNDVSRIVRAWNLGFQILIFMFSFAVESNFSFPEHPGCDDADTEPDCAKFKAPSLAGGHHLCKWDICSQSCSVNEPDGDRASDPRHYIMLLVVLIFTIPFLKTYDFIFENYLIAPLPGRVHALFGTKPRPKKKKTLSQDDNDYLEKQNEAGRPPTAETSDGLEISDATIFGPEKKAMSQSRMSIHFGAPPSAEMVENDDARIDFDDDDDLVEEEETSPRIQSVDSRISDDDDHTAVIMASDYLEQEAARRSNTASPDYVFNYHEASPADEEDFEEGVKLFEEEAKREENRRPQLQRSTSHLLTSRPHLERSTTHDLSIQDFDAELMRKQEEVSGDGDEDDAGSDKEPPITGKIHPGTLIETRSGRTEIRQSRKKDHKHDPIKIAMKESLRNSTVRRRIKVRASMMSRTVRSVWRWSTTKSAQFMDRRGNDVNASSDDIHRARELSSEVAHIVRLQCLEVRELMALVQDRNDDLGRTAYLHLERLYDELLRRWDWVPSNHLFEHNVATILQKQIALAKQWQDELHQLKDGCRGNYIDRADAKLVEYEQISRMNDFERHICNICTDRMASMVSVAPEEPANFTKWCLAWLVLIAIIAVVTYYLILTASNMGRSKSKLWLVSLIASFVLVYGVAVPCEIFFFEGWMPDLVVHRLKAQKPGVMRKFPFRCGDTPYAITFLLEFEPDLRNTKLAKFLSHQQKKEEAHLDRHQDVAVYVEENISDIPEICKHETWLPTIDTRLLIFIVGIFTLLPDDIQETMFEEAVGATPIISARNLPPWITNGGRHGNSDFVTAFIVISAFIIMIFLYFFIELLRFVFRHVYSFLFEDAAATDKVKINEDEDMSHHNT